VARKKPHQSSFLNLDGPWRFAVDPANKDKARAGWSRNLTTEVANYPNAGLLGEQFPKYKTYDGLAWYRREADIPAGWAGTIIRFRCDGLTTTRPFFINGKLAIKSYGYNTPINIDISKLIHPGRKNTIAICVNDTFVNGGIYKSIVLTAESAQTPPPRFKQPQRQLDREMFAQENAAGFAPITHE